MRKIMMMTMLLLVTLAANAQSEVYAYIVDASGTPTNVRNAPNGKVVQQLDNEESLVVNLLSAQGNWWRIAPLVEIYGDNEGELTLKGSKSGYWIHNSVLQFGVAGDPAGCLRKSPSWKAKAVTIGNSTDMSFRPLAISGQWVKVVTTDGRYTGWMHRDKICSNPLTTCP